MPKIGDSNGRVPSIDRQALAEDDQNNASTQAYRATPLQLNPQSNTFPETLLENRKITANNPNSRYLHENNLLQILRLASEHSIPGFSSSLLHHIDDMEQLEQVIARLPPSIRELPSIQETIILHGSQLMAANIAGVLIYGLL